MKPLSLPYVYEFEDRHGKVRRYFRRNGVTRPMPEGVTSNAKAYVEALAASEVRKRAVDIPSPYPKGSFGALTTSYEGSAGFKQLAPATRRELGYMIKRLRGAHGERQVTRLTRADVLAWQDELAERPGTANNMLRCMKILMRFAADHGWRLDNPLWRIKELKGGEFRAWTDEEHSKFEARWPLGTMQRRAYAIALYTGQRKSDIVNMRITARSGGSITLVQQKTGEPLVIPETSEFSKELDAMKPPGLMMIWKDGGGAMTSDYFGAMMRKAIRDALGEETDCVFHGLRNSAAKRLADAGCTPHQIMAVTGHKTIRMVEKYTRQASQKKLASAAIIKLESAAK